MSGRFLTDLADVCRGAGLVTVENSGWQTRARSSGGYTGDRPWCVVWHHTASQASPENDVAYIVSGSSDAPLANLYLARDGSVHVCAAGATNTNGKGGPLAFSRGTVPVDQMNTHAIGVEAANSGVGEAWPQVQVDAYFALSNALCAAYGLLPSDITSHEHWSPGRKIDPATAPAVQGPWRPRGINSSGTWSLDDMRAEAVARSGSQPQPQPEPAEDDMEICEVKVSGANARFLGIRSRQTTTAVDGTTAPRVFVLWVEWVNGNDQLQLTRYQTYQNLGVPIQELNPPDLRGVGLLGPVPTGDALRSWSRDDFGNVIT